MEVLQNYDAENFRLNLTLTQDGEKIQVLNQTGGTEAY
jgi:hypothetical protein